MDMFDCADYLKGTPLSATPTSGSGSNSTNAHTITGKATSDSSEGYVYVDMGGDTVASDQSQSIKMATTVSVKNGDTVIINAAGADATGKTPLVIGVVGRGDETEEEIKTVSATASAAAKVAATAQKAADEAKETATATGQHFWDDTNGAHVSTAENSTSTGGSSTWNSKGMIIQKDGTTLASHTGSGTNYYDSDGNVIASYNSSGAQIGKTSGVHASTSSTSFAILNGSGEVLSEMTGDTIRLGENSTASQIHFCGSEGKIRVNNGNLSIGLSSSAGQANIASLSADPDDNTAGGYYLEKTNGYVALTLNGDEIFIKGGSTSTVVVDIDSLKTRVCHTVLYPSSGEESATTSDISLTKSAGNYKYLEIFYHDTDSAYESKRIFSPNGKIMKLSTVQVGGTNTLLSIKSRWVQISGSSITTLYTAEEFDHNSSTTEGTHTDKIIAQNKILIDRVEGWN